MKSIAFMLCAVLPFGALHAQDYAHGGHAFGLRRTEQPITQWPTLVEIWLRTIGVTGSE